MPNDRTPSKPQPPKKSAASKKNDEAQVLDTQDFEVVEVPGADMTPPPVPAANAPEARPAPPARASGAASPPGNARAATPLVERSAKVRAFRPAPAGAAPTPRGGNRAGLPPLPTGAEGEPADPRLDHARELVKTCEAELSASPSPAQGARLHYEIARVCERPLADLVRAAAHYQEALSLLPDHLPSVRGARRVLIARKDYNGALALFDAEARLLPKPEQKAAIHVAKGEMLETVLSRRAEARAAYEQALALAPGDPSVLKAHERWDTEAGDYEALARTWERAANTAGGDVRHRAALIAQRARLLESDGNNVSAAVDLFQSALDLDPDAPGALDALKRLYRERQRWRDLVAVLDVEAQRTSDPSVASMALYRIGRLHAERLGAVESGIAALTSACEKTPSDPLPLAELCLLLEETESWPELAVALERLIAISDDEPTRLDRIHRLGQVLDLQLHDDANATAWYERALALDPLFVPGLRALSGQYTKREDWPALIAMNLAEAEASAESARKATCHRRVAELYEARLSQPGEAAEHYARALGYAPGDEICIRALCRLYSEAAEYNRLIELYQRALDVAPSKEQAIAWLFEIGHTFEDVLRQPDQATAAYRRVLSLDSEHLGAIQALQRSCERAGQHRELVDALELEAARTTDRNRTVELRYRAGQVLAEHLGDMESAQICFQRVLEVDGAHLPSIAALGRVYYREGRWEDLLDTYRRQLEVTPRGEAQVNTLHKMGELCEEHLGREAQAIANYKRAITLDPGYQPSLQRLARRYQQRREWAELVRVLELQLKSCDTPEERAVVAYRLGEVAEEQLGQPDRAISAYVQALNEAPGYRPAFDALTRLRAGRHAWGRLIEDLDREAKRAADPMLTIAARMRQAEIYATSLNEPRRAIETYQTVLEARPDHLGALLALEPLYAKVGDDEALAGLYEQQAQVLKATGPRVAALRELARVQARAGLGGPEALRQTYDAILALVPDDLWALTSLETLATERNDPEWLADVARREAETTEDDALRSAHLMRQAEALEAARSEEAVDVYRAALTAEPYNLGAIRGLARAAEQVGDAGAMVEALEREADITLRGAVAAERLVFSARLRSTALADNAGAITALERALLRWPDSVEAAARLEERLRETDQTQHLADVLSQAAHAATDTGRVADLWGRVARLQADELGNLPGAIAALVRVLKTEPDHVGTILQLADLYARNGQWREACEHLQRVVTLSSDRRLLCEANLRLAGIHADHLGEPAKAVTFLKGVLSLDANNRDALARLADLSAAGGDPTEAASLARRLVSTSADPAEKAAALLRLGRAERAHGRLQTATDALREAVVLEGPTGPAAAELETLVSETGNWDLLLDAVEKHLAVAAAEGLDRTPIYRALARLQAGPLGNPQAAVRTLERARKEGTPTFETNLELAEYQLAAGQAAEATRGLRALLTQDLARPDLWRAFANALQALGRPGEARLALSPVSVLSEPTPDEERILFEQRSTPAHVRAGSMRADVLREIEGNGKALEPVEAMLAVLAEGLGKLYTPKLERYEVGPRDKLENPEAHPLVGLARRVGQAFGVDSFDLYLHRRSDRGFGIEPTEVPSVLVPAELTRLSEAQQVFLLGRPFAYLARNAHPLYRMTPQELEILLAAAARTADESFGLGLSSEEFLNQQAKRIAKALSRKARKQLEEAAEAYAARPRFKFADWVERLDRTAARAALVLADDLLGCVDLLRGTEPDLAQLSGRALLEESELIRDLVEFWMSDPALRLRRRSGLLPMAESAW